MSAARDVILSRIQSGLGRGELSETSRKTLNEKLAVPTRSVTPGRVRLSGAELAEEFIRMTKGEATTVSKVKNHEDVPEAVSVFIGKHKLSQSVVLAPDKNIERMPWEKTAVDVRTGRAEKEDITSVTPGFAGIAETGCFLLLSGPGHPYTLNFLPENHIVVLERSRIVATPEDAFGLLRKDFGFSIIPRFVLMVAGPSRSADIGTSLQFGAHGPKRLHCLLVG